jgi:hypothetical protein
VPRLESQNRKPDNGPDMPVPEIHCNPRSSTRVRLAHHYRPQWVRSKVLLWELPSAQQTERPTERLTGRQTGRPMGRQTGRQTGQPWASQ